MTTTDALSSRLTPIQRRFRALGRRLALFVEARLTHTIITGRENISTHSPVIFAGNHASTYDAVLLIAHLPEATQLVGPGDFKLLFPAEELIELAGIVRIKRASLDRDSLRLMSGALEAGLNLALFPEGGTWEKRLDDVKPGVAYLSHLHHVPVVPISVGGTYQVWQRIFLLQRPEIRIHFGEPLPPVEITDRKQRAQGLQDYSLMLMQRIYDRLPPEDQARYDNAARKRYRAELVANPAGTVEALSGAPLPDFSVLAELASKPNLLSPLWHNARLPLIPLAKHGRFYPAADFAIAAERLHSALVGEFADYLNYRLGDARAAQALDELDALRQSALAAHRHRSKLKFVIYESLVD